MIESVNNEKIKEYSKLQQKKYRQRTGLFIVEGEHLVSEAIKHGVVKEIFSLDTRDNATKVSVDVMKKLSNLDTVPNILAVCHIKENTEIFGNILILDDIQDPGNLGTIIRSAVAFGIDTIIASNNTVDLYNSKVLRSSEGMFFNINYIKQDLISVLNGLKDTHEIYTTNVIEGESLDKIEIKRPYAIIMGNEGSGVSNSIAKYSNKTIYIPMSMKCESLNVAIATSIILYEFNKK